MKTRMTSYKVYGVWEYEQEITDLNNRSAMGWQLEKGGCFHSKFIRNEKVRYLYQLDYAPKLENKERYLSFFREQGWEYINSTYNGWHYFRREYQENMPYEEAEIYTDQESLLEMQGRYYRGIRFFAILFLIFAVVGAIRMWMTRSLELLSTVVFDGVWSAMMWLVVFNIKRKQSGKREILPIKGQSFIFLLIILSIILLFITIFI